MTTIPEATEPAPVDDVLADVKQRLRDAEAPLRATLDQIHARLLDLERERATLGEARRRLEATLRTLDPERALPGAKHGGKSKLNSYRAKEAPTSEKGRVSAAYAERWIEEHGDDLREGFTAADVYRGIQENGNPPPPRPVGADIIRGVVKSMHERGLIRLDKVVRGGAKSYKLVEEGEA